MHLRRKRLPLVRSTAARRAEGGSTHKLHVLGLISESTCFEHSGRSDASRHRRLDYKNRQKSRGANFTG
jgi:hypothetical protein